MRNLLLAGASALLLAGCGAGPSISERAGSSSPTPTASAPTPTPSPTPTPTAAASQRLTAVDVFPCLAQTVVPGRTLASLVIPDVVTVDTTKLAGFPNGRQPLDPVIDATLAAAFLDLTKVSVETFARLPLNPPASSGNPINSFPNDFPYLAPAVGGAPAAVGGSGFVFRTEPASAYRRIDRMGMPAVATALVRSSAKNPYNDDSPADDLASKWATEFRETLTDFTAQVYDDFTARGYPLCARPL